MIITARGNCPIVCSCGVWSHIEMNLKACLRSQLCMVSCCYRVQQLLYEHKAFKMLVELDCCAAPRGAYTIGGTNHSRSNCCISLQCIELQGVAAVTAVTTVLTVAMVFVVDI